MTKTEAINHFYDLANDVKLIRSLMLLQGDIPEDVETALKELIAHYMKCRDRVASAE
jgi:hypothetical protein